MCGLSTPFVGDVAELGAFSRALHFKLHRIQSHSSQDFDCKSSREAFEELLGSSAGASAYQAPPGSGTTVRPYDKDLVAWPEIGDQPVPLSKTGSPSLLRLIGGPPSAWMWSETELKKRLVEEPMPRLYKDEVFARDRSAYLGFCREGLARGIFTVGRKRKGKVEPFFVIKKNGMLRIIMDCRQVNRLFKKPPGVNLFSGAGHVEVWAGTENELFFGGADVAHAFYQHELPVELRPLFSLPAVTASEIGISQVGGMYVGQQTRLYPQLRVVPMGWNWAMWIVQRVHESILLRCPKLLGVPIARVFVPPPDPRKRPFLSLYVDNLTAEGCYRQATEALRRAAVESFREVGLPVHEEVEATREMDTLGVAQEGKPPLVRLTDKRYRRLWGALDHLVETRGRATSKEMEQMCGHFTFAALIYRGYLSLMRATYNFSRAGFRTSQPLWPSVAAELRTMRDLLPLLFTPLDRPYCSTVWQTDACESGHAGVTASVDTELVRAIARWAERWRYKGEWDGDDPMAPRERVAAQLKEHVRSPPITLIHHQNESFPEVPVGPLKSYSWETAYKSNCLVVRRCTLKK